jgi:hypothetical protein
LELTDANWQEKTLYRTGDTVYIQVIDADENEDSTSKDSLSVSVVSDTETEAETVILTETNIATGIFQGSIELDEQENAVADGKLQVAYKDNITVTYQDLTDDWGNSITISKTASYQASPVTISTDTTWTLDNSPYIFTRDVIVEEGATLTIEPGVEVKFAAHRDDSEGGSDSSLSELIIYGGLNAIGTATNRIKFTSNADSPAAGDWGGIKFTLYGSYGPLLIYYSDIKYADIGITGGSPYRRPPLIDNCIISDSNTGIRGVGMGDGSITITNSNIGSSISVSSQGFGVTIINNLIGGGIFLNTQDVYGTIKYNTITGGISRDSCSTGWCPSSLSIEYNYISSNTTGIYFIIEGNSPYSSVSYNNIVANRGYGIYCTGKGNTLRVNQNNLYGSANYDFYNNTSSELDAKYNYWGTVATSEMDAGGNPKDISTIWDYFDGGSDYGMVNYSNWLNEPILLPPTAVMATPGDTTIDLSWTESVGAAGYYLYYGLSSGNYGSPIDVGNNTSYELTGLSNDTTYYIALTSYDDQGNESTYSYEGRPLQGLQAYQVKQGRMLLT